MIGNFAHGNACEAAVIAGGKRLVGIGDVDEVMRDAGSLFGRGFGSAEIHAAIDGDGIAVDNFSAEALGEGEGERGFAAAGGAEQKHSERVVWIRQGDPQRMKHEMLDWRIWRGGHRGTSAVWR